MKVQILNKSHKQVSRMPIWLIKHTYETRMNPVHRISTIKSLVLRRSFAICRFGWHGSLISSLSGSLSLWLACQTAQAQLALEHRSGTWF